MPARSQFVSSCGLLKSGSHLLASDRSFGSPANDGNDLCSPLPTYRTSPASPSRSMAAGSTMLLRMGRLRRVALIVAAGDTGQAGRHSKLGTLFVAALADLV